MSSTRPLSFAGFWSVKRKMGAEPTVMLAHSPLYQDMLSVPLLSRNSLNCREQQAAAAAAAANQQEPVVVQGHPLACQGPFTNVTTRVADAAEDPVGVTAGKRAVISPTLTFMPLNRPGGWSGVLFL